MSLTVLEPGLDTRIVDAGRPRTRSLGVPVGGAADRRALALGNALLGNPSDAAALEIALRGPCLTANRNLACALYGAPFEGFVGNALGGMRIEVGSTFMMREGQKLVLSGTNKGMRAYLCVQGGFQAEAILGSRSGLEPVRKSQTLLCESSHIHGRFCPAVLPSFPDQWTVRVLAGLQASWFTEAEFYEQDFLVSTASNRMGLRLGGKPLKVPERELVSEPVCPGAVQVTRDGQCIVLGVDGQTIGGYPKIAQVIQADLDALGQVRPGQRLRFTKISMQEALTADREAARELHLWTMRLRVSLDGFAETRRFASS
jgi:biotin-dependent carboxylase-like uncharacterized protein